MPETGSHELEENDHSASSL
jgi:hypothetical protein